MRPELRHLLMARVVIRSLGNISQYEPSDVALRQGKIAADTDPLVSFLGQVELLELKVASGVFFLLAACTLWRLVLVRAVEDVT